MQSYTAPKQVLDDVPMEEAGGGDGEGNDPFAGRGPQRVVDRESDYHRRRLARALSPSRGDAFSSAADAKKTKGKSKQGGGESSSYADVMKAAALARERDNTLANIRAKERAKEAGEAAAAAAAAAASSGSMTAEQFHALKVERDLGGRNRPWTSDELDSLLPGPR